MKRSSAKSAIRMEARFMVIQDKITLPDGKTIYTNWTCNDVEEFCKDKNLDLEKDKYYWGLK